MPIGGRHSAPNDARNNEAGLLLIGAGAILLLVSLFLDWYDQGTDAFEAFEVWDLVLAMLAIAALAAVASRFGFGARRPASWLIVPTVAALVIVLFALINPPPVAAAIDDDPEIGLWLALAATILMAAGALLSVARISVALATPGAAGDRPGRHAGTTGDAPYEEPGPPRTGRRFMGASDGPAVAEPADPAAPGAVPPTEPTRRI